MERSPAGNTHSRAQLELLYRFRRHQDDLRLFPRGELRVRVAPGQIRVPDVLVYSGHEPTGEMPDQVPLIAIEIVSRDDRHEEIMSKLADYETWGVPHVWLVDPGLRRFSAYSNGSLNAVPAFQLPGPGITIHASEILG